MPRRKNSAITLIATGEAMGLQVATHISDGNQPVGAGIGPALEARDVLAVLRNEAGAPKDLRKRSLELAGRLLQMANLKDEDGNKLNSIRAVLSARRRYAGFYGSLTTSSYRFVKLRVDSLNQKKPLINT